MSPAVLLACLLAVGLPVQGFEALERDLAAGRFRAAEEALAGEPDPLRRSWGEVELAFRARDFATALARAEEALGTNPGDARLLLRATGAAVWLERPAVGERHLHALRAAVARLDAADRDAWAGTLDDLAGQLDELRARDASLRDHVTRARWVAGAGIAVVLGGLLLGARRWSA